MLHFLIAIIAVIIDQVLESDLTGFVKIAATANIIISAINGAIRKDHISVRQLTQSIKEVSGLNYLCISNPLHCRNP